MYFPRSQVPTCAAVSNAAPLVPNVLGHSEDHARSQASKLVRSRSEPGEASASSTARARTAGFPRTGGPSRVPSGTPARRRISQAVAMRYSVPHGTARARSGATRPTARGGLCRSSGRSAVCFSPHRVTEDIDLVPLGGADSRRYELMDFALAQGLPLAAVNSAADVFLRREEGFVEASSFFESLAPFRGSLVDQSPCRFRASRSHREQFDGGGCRASFLAKVRLAPCQAIGRREP
jgi:hypothetical protein